MSDRPVTYRTLPSDVETRRRRRALMRAHHPDLGGDPAAFIEALQRLDQHCGTEAPPAEVSFVRRRRWWVLGRSRLRTRPATRVI
jgi:hypothetical protein